MRREPRVPKHSKARYSVFRFSIPLALTLLVASVDPVSIRVRGGGMSPVTVLVTVRMLPHGDNRAVCVTLADEEGNPVIHDCRPLAGERGPNTTDMLFKDLDGNGEWTAWASLCRGGWNAADDTCAQKWLQSNHERFFVIGRGGNTRNLEQKKRKP